MDFHLPYYYNPADCSVLRTFSILETFEIRPVGLLSHVFAGSKVMDFHLPYYYDATDCSAFHAPAILKIFEIRPVGLLSHIFAGSKVMDFHVNMKSMTF